MPVPATIWREIYERLRSPNGARYAAEIVEINRRYPADYVFMNGERCYSNACSLPSAAEIEHYHDYGHLWDPAALADFLPRYQAYLSIQPPSGVVAPNSDD